MKASGPLVTVEQLANHASDPGVRIVDTRWYLAKKIGLDEYRRGHIPGALFCDLDRDLSAPKGSGPGRHPLPRAPDFAAALSRLGIERDTIVVAYDDSGGAIAARLWWLLRHFGHAGGRVLDGGLAAWTAAGHPLATGDEPLPEPAPLMTLAPRTGEVVDKRAVAALASSSSARVYDARARERYAGDIEPIDARPGHIPGAHSAPFAENLDSSGAFRSTAELAQRYADLGALEAEKVVFYCGSGVTACHDVLALTLAGRDDALLYEGSWSDWAADDSLPAKLGLE